MFVDSETDNHAISDLCRVMDISRSGYYAWRKRPECRRRIEDGKLKAHILGIFSKNRSVYGVARIMVCLKRKDIQISKRRCSRLMKELQIQGVSKKKKRPHARSEKPQMKNAADLICRNFFAAAPNEAWFADITYVKTYEGWLYLAVVFDIFSRMVVGWSMDDTMCAKLVDDAVKMGIVRRDPKEGLVHHSDHGSQYRSLLLSKTLTRAGIIPSMGAIASPWDNAVTESLISTIKAECIDGKTYESRKQAVMDIFDYIEVFYNKMRIHSSIGMVSPKEFEDRYYERLALAS